MRNELKNELKDNYTIIPNELILDNSISDRARFVFCILASKPNNWKFYNNALAKELGYSVDTLRKYINELIENGWIEKIRQTKDERGRFTGNTYKLSATKITVSEKKRHGKTPTQKNPDTYKEVTTIRSNYKQEVKNISSKIKNDDAIGLTEYWIDFYKNERWYQYVAKDEEKYKANCIDAFDKMIRLDKITPQEIKKIVYALFNPKFGLYDFWIELGNIRTPKKFRQKMRSGDMTYYENFKLKVQSKSIANKFKKAESWFATDNG